MACFIMYAVEHNSKCVLNLELAQPFLRDRNFNKQLSMWKSKTQIPSYIKSY